METIPLFDIPKGERLKEEAIQASLRHARENWKRAATNAIQVCALRYDFFTTDQVEAVLRESSVAMTHDARALGGLMTGAKNQGWIELTDRVRPSALPQNHRRPKRIWRSTIRERR